MNPSTAWKEDIAADEPAKLEGYAHKLAALQKLNQRGATRRALHAKSHGVLEATLAIAADLPEHARHGLFAKPATYEALVRFSNGAGRVQHDKVGDVRGMAVKVLGVPGPKVLGDGTTQDLLGILSPAIPFKNADEFVAVVWATRNPALALFRLIGALGPVRPFQLLRKVVAPMRVPPGSLLTRRFFSAAPIQCGPYAIRCAFTPATEQQVPEGASLADDLAARLARGPVAYDLEIQFFADATTTPIEDTSVDWPSPYLKVGTLTIAKQDAASDRGKRLAERGDALAFDPWHALVEHKPLGGIMRARKSAYYASEHARGAAPDPASIAALLGA